MLETPLPEKTLQYLNEAVGSEFARLGPAEPAATGMPHFLSDAYDIVKGQLLGHRFALACVKERQLMAAGQIQRHMQTLRQHLEIPVIVSLPAVTPGERKKLIQQGVAFVVPGTQLFAPELGIILTERFPLQAKLTSEHASPATQALLIRFLLGDPADTAWHPFEAAATLGYTAMTATRALRELLHFGLFELETRGREKHLNLRCTRRELWDKAKAHLRTPVQRMLWTYQQGLETMRGIRLAGESALTRVTMIDDPGQLTIAASVDVIQQLERQGVRFEPREAPDAVAIQIWRYDPASLAPGTAIDPLSLWLSLRSHRDDRVQIALEEIEEAFPW